MRILQLCYKPPFPPVDGGTLAINSVTQGLLQAECSVKVLTVATDKHPCDMARIPDDYKQATQIESVYIDTRIKVFSALAALLSGTSYHVQRYESSEMKAKLVSALSAQQFDIVHVESIFLTPYLPIIRKYSQAKVVLRAHNVEHLIWRQLSSGEKNPLRKWYLRHLALTLEVYERSHINQYDGVICITPNDVVKYCEMGCTRPIVSIPFAIEHEPISDVVEEPNSLFHIGSMDWKPNIEAINWFLSRVWPLVHQELPALKLYLAGRSMPNSLCKSKTDGVIIVGEVDDARRFISSKQINIVPLLSGGGIRVKILEAMSAGKVVIATSVAARGINYTDGQNILIADTPDDFLRQLKLCVTNPSLVSEIGRNAAKLIDDEYSLTFQTNKIVDFYKQLLGSNH